jgi:hypothetical protein
MHYWRWLIPCLILCAGCQEREEESADLERMAIVDEEEEVIEFPVDRKEIAGELPFCPQESPIREDLQ